MRWRDVRSAWCLGLTARRTQLCTATYINYIQHYYYVVVSSDIEMADLGRKISANFATATLSDRAAPAGARGAPRAPARESPACTDQDRRGAVPRRDMTGPQDSAGEVDLAPVLLAV